MKTTLPLLSLLALAGAVTNSLALPVITNPPIDLTLCQGETATYIVGATGTPPLTYQWRDHTSASVFTNIVDATNDTLVLTNAQPTSHRYAVVVSDVNGSVTSTPLARLTVVVPPGITSQPTSQTLEVGQNYTNKVVASGTPPFTYQWYFNGQLLPGKTATNLIIPNVQGTNTGDYSVSVANDCGSVTSQLARLVVSAAGVAFTRITNSPVVTNSSAPLASAWADYDSDGLVDLFLTQGADVTRDTNRLYRNLGGGNFQRVLDEPFASDREGFMGTAWFDYNNDGHPDLFIASYDGPSRIYRNDGGGLFTRIYDPVLALRATNGVAVACGDYDNDGYVDVFITYWDAFAFGNSLLRNDGDGTFTALTAGDVVADRPSPSGSAGAGWADYNNDGNLDLVVCSRGAGALLYTNRGNGQLSRVVGSVLEGHYGAVNPAWGDYDNDGFLDLFIAAGTFGGQNALYRNNHDGSFTPIPFADSGNSVAATWGDCDNDGWLDLFVARGNNISETDLFYHNNGDGTFTRILSAEVGKVSHHALSASWADYDNDGFLDLFVSVWIEPNCLYHNNGNTNQWLTVKLIGTVCNRAALGAKVRVQATIAGATRWQMRQLQGDGFGQNDLRAHFGLGDATNVETLRVEWPSGQVTELHNVAARQFLTITEPPLLRCAGMTGEGFCMTLTGNVGVRYEVLTSSNLTDWVPWQSVTNTSRTMPMIDASVTSQPHRFYKATLTP